MKLISAAASPFVRKVRALILETGQTDDVEMVTVQTAPTAPDPKARAANPTGKIPALLRNDGPAIYDSRVITRYLNARAVKNGNTGADGIVDFYPETRIWEILTLEATADAIMDAAVLVVYEARLRPDAQQSTAWTDAQWAKVTGALGAINERWMSHLSGPTDMSHIAVGCALGYLDFRLDARNWRQGNDALNEWYAAFSTRESMVATAPE